MPAQALYLKWRPRTFDDVIGQPHITRLLRNALIQDRIRHAYVFSGPRGTGKTTMARLLAKALNCTHPDITQRPCDVCDNCRNITEGRYLDLLEIDAASNNSVDDVRDLREKIAFAPTEGRYKVYIVDEVHRFSSAAFDALLKTLEEPPGHTIFILATTELDKVPATIKSRSQIYVFHRVSVHDVADRLELIAVSEGVQVDRDVLELVAQYGSGSVRDSISLLDQLIVDVNERVSMSQVEQILGTAGNRYTGKLVNALVNNDTTTALDVLNIAIEEGAEPSQFAKQIVDYLRNVMLVQTGGPQLVDTTTEMRATLQEQAKRISRAGIIRAVRAFNQAALEIRSGWTPQLPLEIAIIESTRPIQDEVILSRPVVGAATPSAADKGQPSSDLATGAASKSSIDDVVEIDDITQTQLEQKWPAVLDVMRPYPNYLPLTKMLEKTKVKAVRGKQLTLMVDNSTLKNRLEDKDNQKAIIRAIRRATGFVATGLRIVIRDEVERQMEAALEDDPFLHDIMEQHPSTISNIEDLQEGN